MQILQLTLVIGAASANPLGLFERQAPAACTATYLPSCTGAASTSARAWCASQGFGKASATVTRTNVNYRTVGSTVTTYTSTLTVTARTSTRTVSSVRTVVTTSTTTGPTTVDRTSIIPVTGRASAFPVYIPAQAPTPEIESLTETTSSMRNIDTPISTSSVPSSTSSAPPAPTFTWQPRAKPDGCVEESRHVYADSNGQAYEYIRCKGHGDSIINQGNRYAGVSVTSFEQCAQFCRFKEKCNGFNWLVNNPTACNVVLEGVGRFQAIYSTDWPWYYHHLVKMTTAQLEQQVSPTSTSAPPQQPTSVAPPPGCSATQEQQFTDHDGVRRVYKSCLGYAYTPGTDNIYPHKSGDPTTCNLLMSAPQVLQTGHGPNYPWSYYHFTGQVVQFAVARKREVDEPVTHGVAKRQATATVPKPVCVRATNALQTTSACRCAIPSTTTTTSTFTAQTTTTRTIVVTSRLVSTTTVTPTIATTVFRTTTLTRQRQSAVTTTRMHTTESTVTWTLGATPTALYIADNYEEGARHFVEWPADAEEIYYHIQYDWSAGDDEWAPTVFNLDEGQTLRVADLDNHNTEGALENYVVVGKNHDGDGMQNGSPTDGIHIVATQDGGGNDAVQCRIEPTEDDQCALLCSSGSYTVNSRDGDGLWNLMSNGTEWQFTNYVFAANVELEERSAFREREMEMRRAVVKAKQN
ncbi:hypothetical protein Slin15195_G116580 [Septoria linicola]|uniref:Apple domain-containing protein n=1 Tax=Septoria linicola TaxID=215465 RepID=A0A9Q9AZP8_9PEZI|nr:hypothetical protein Slin15195_G116580 [Septoria linicola]